MPRWFQPPTVTPIQAQKVAKISFATSPCACLAVRGRALPVAAHGARWSHVRLLWSTYTHGYYPSQPPPALNARRSIHVPMVHVRREGSCVVALETVVLGVVRFLTTPSRCTPAMPPCASTARLDHYRPFLGASPDPCSPVHLPARTIARSGRATGRPSCGPAAAAAPAGIPAYQAGQHSGTCISSFLFHVRYGLQGH